MAKKANPLHQSIQQLVQYLDARREPILNNWRTRCSVDADLHTRTSFSREEFTDQAPVLINGVADTVGVYTPQKAVNQLYTKYLLRKFMLLTFVLEIN